MKKPVYFKQLKKRFYIITLVLIILVSILYQLPNSVNLMSFIQFMTKGSQISAEVIDSQAKETKASWNTLNSNLHKSEITVKYDYLIKYKFSLQKLNNSYKNEKWVSIDETLWRNSIKSKKIDVVYIDERPEINAPKAIIDSYLYDFTTKTLLIIIASIGFSFAIVFMMFGDLKNRGLYQNRKN